MDTFVGTIDVGNRGQKAQAFVVVVAEREMCPWAISIRFW
jgi:hypothetical protein